MRRNAMTTPDASDATEWADLPDEQREIFLEAMKRSGLDTEALTKPKPESETESDA
jgi:TRAP-type C4-dicarboxylate transport system substrate-binding protein